MRMFGMVFRGILTIPALAIGLMLNFLAIVLNLATGVLERLAGAVASLLAGGMTLLLLVMLAIDKDFVPEHWILWAVMYGIAGVLYIAPYIMDYIIIGISSAGDWLLRIPPWKGALL